MERRGKYLVICADCEGTGEQIQRLAAQMERAGWTSNFFFVGETVREYPALVREIAAAGHEIHSHTWSHPNLRKLSLEQQRGEILRGRDAVEQCVGRSAPGFRAPMHHLNRDTVRVLCEGGFRFDASNLYFRYNMGQVVEFAPTWFREWMPLYETLRVSPKAAFRLFKMLARAARLPILPAHPHYAGKDDALATAFGDFLLWARDAGYRPATFEELLGLSTAELAPLIGYQPALESRRLGEKPSAPKKTPAEKPEPPAQEPRNGRDKSADNKPARGGGKKKSRPSRGGKK